MSVFRDKIESFLDNGSSLPDAMFQTYLPAIESIFSSLHLNFSSPEDGQHIIGGRAMEGDLQGLLIVFDETDYDIEITKNSIARLSEHVDSFLYLAKEQKAYPTSSEGISDLHSQFALKSKSGVNLSSQTTVVIISRGILNFEFFERTEYDLPIEIIDGILAERSYGLNEEEIQESSDELFNFDSTRHKLPKVFKDPSPSSSHSIHMGHITGSALCEMFHFFGRKMIEVNVRDFLGDTSINKGMRTTITDDPDRFAAFNNGLTIVCSGINIENDEIISITGPSVVNGGQTTMVIVDEARKGTPVDQIRVPIRVVEITSDKAVDKLGFAALISRFANTQNNIKTTDQLVNESPHPELNKFCDDNHSELNGWYYAHRRGMIKTRHLEMGARFKQWEEKHPGNKRVEAIDAATMWSAWIGEPAAAALGPQRCFTFYHGYVTTENAKERLIPSNFLKQTFALKILRDNLRAKSQISKQTTMFSATLPHTLGWFSHITEHKYDLIQLFNNGSVDQDTGYILGTLFDQVNSFLRKIEEELPSEYAKRKECSEAIQSIKLGSEVMDKLKKLPLTNDRPLKGEPLGGFLVRIGKTKLWDAFNFVKTEHSDGNMGGMGKDFFNGMRYGFDKKGENMDAREVIKLMRVWNLANQLGYSTQYPGELDLYMKGK